MGQLAALSQEQLAAVTDADTAKWLYELAQGIDHEAVTDRLLLKSVGCGKNFPGLTTVDEVKFWLSQLCGEMVERLNQDRKENNRIAMNVIFHVRCENSSDSYSKTLPIHKYDVESIMNEVLKNGLTRLPVKSDAKFEPIINLSLIASKFTDADTIEKSAVFKTKKVDSYFNRCERPSGDLCASVSVDQSESRDGVANSPVAEWAVVNREVESDPQEADTFVISRGFFYRKTLQLAGDQKT